MPEGNIPAVPNDDPRIMAAARQLYETDPRANDDRHFYHWPEHPADDGYRGGGAYVTLLPARQQNDYLLMAKAAIAAADAVAPPAYDAWNAASSNPEYLKFSYRNWKGETGVRTVAPTQIWYGATEYHPEKQWFLKALDLDKDEERDFALADFAGVQAAALPDPAKSAEIQVFLVKENMKLVSENTCRGIENARLKKHVTALETSLKSALAWVQHWQADVAGNLKPTEESLQRVEREISVALAKVEVQP